MVAEGKRQIINDQRQRNPIEGKIGQGKRLYGLDITSEKLAAT
jgi:IS5 family transposase